MSLMATYTEQLTDDERQEIEIALDCLKDGIMVLGGKLAGDDRAARAAEALAVYIVASRT